MVLEQDRDHAAERSEDGVVDHQGPRAAAVGGDVGRLEPLRQHAVELHRAALPGSSQPVAQREFQLRSVERTFAGVDLRREAAAPRGIAELRLRPVPGRVVAGARRRPRRQRHLVVGKTKVAVGLAQQGDEARDFALHVLLAAEHMRVVLLEGARPHDAVERTHSGSEAPATSAAPC